MADTYTESMLSKWKPVATLGANLCALHASTGNHAPGRGFGHDRSIEPRAHLAALQVAGQRTDQEPLDITGSDVPHSRTPHRIYRECRQGRRDASARH